jgi:two-component system chemotaxis response regulator CheB
VLKLLIADDSALMRKYLIEIFKSEGDFAVSVARNGAEALLLAQSFNPDVITLDVNMPEMDGITCLSRIMVECPKPVVMVSSLTSQGAEVTLQALDLGAIDFISKPDGTVSLHIDKIRVQLVAKVRAAAKARIRNSRGLLQRVRHTAQSAAAKPGSGFSIQRPASRSPFRQSNPGARPNWRLNRWAGRHRKYHPQAAGRFPLADPDRPAHAGEFHGRFRSSNQFVVCPRSG